MLSDGAQAVHLPAARSPLRSRRELRRVLRNRQPVCRARMEAPTPLPSLTEKLHKALGAISDIGAQPSTHHVLAPSAAYNPLPPRTTPVFYNASAGERPFQPDAVTAATGTVYCDAAHNVHRLSSESSVSRQGAGQGGRPKPGAASKPAAAPKSKPSLLLIIAIVVGVLAVGLLVAMYFIRKAAAKKKLKEYQEAEALKREIDAAEAEQQAQAANVALKTQSIAAAEAQARAQAETQARAQAEAQAQARAQFIQAETIRRQIDAQVAAARQIAAGRPHASEPKGPRVEDVTDDVDSGQASTTSNDAAPVQPVAVPVVQTSLFAASSGAAAQTLSTDAHRLRIGEGMSQMAQGVQQAIMAQRTQGPREVQRDESVLLDRSAALLQAPSGSQTPLDAAALAQPVRRSVLRVPAVGTSGALASLEEDEDASSV